MKKLESEQEIYIENTERNKGMSKQIGFPLEMDNEVKVRDLESLKTHFSIVRILDYLKSGKLITWLKVRYADEIIESLGEIDLEDSELPYKVCKAFGLEFDEKAQEEYKKATARAERIAKVKEYTENAEYIDNIDLVAFVQDDVYALLEDEQEKIYLCGDRFSIPLTQSGITYIGINAPMVVIDSSVEVDWKSMGISFNGVIFDEEYQKIVEEAKTEYIQKKQPEINRFNKYNSNSIFNCMLSSEEKEASKVCFNMIASIIEKYDADVEIKNTKNIILNENIIGAAEKYLRKL